MSAWDRQQSVDVRQSTAVDQGLRSYMLKVYNYMTSGVLLTAVIAYFAGNSEAFQQAVVSMGPQGPQLAPLGWIIALAPLGMGFFVLPRMHRMSEQGVQMAFWGYAVVMGLALWSIFAAYTEASILRVLLITAGTFGLLSLYGYTTKRDLTQIRTFLFVGVLAVFLVSIVNLIFLKSSGLDLALSYVGVVLGLGLTAYYTQETKDIYYRHGGSKHAIIIAATNLYFAFIYLFMNLLRIMAERR